MELRNGTNVDDPRLDRLYELDWRSLNYTVGEQLLQTTAPVYRPRSYTWKVDAWLDQGREGACVGFACAHDLAARPVVVDDVTSPYARKIYHDAQRIDPWAGGSYPGASPFYEGTSILAGVKTCQKEGFFDSYYWALGIEELAQGLAYFGPCILGLNWYVGMFDTDKDGFIHVTGKIAGGHAILAHSIKIAYKSVWSGWRNRTWRDVDMDKSYVVLHNSWGRSWGQNGRAKLSLTNLNRLLMEHGDAAFPVRTAKKSITA